MKLNSYSEKFKEVKIAEGIFFEDERGFLKKTMFGDELSNTMEKLSSTLKSLHPILDSMTIPVATPILETIPPPPPTSTPITSTPSNIVNITTNNNDDE